MRAVCGERSRTIKIAPSVMCANLLHLEKDIKELERAGCHLFHFDIMDGHFVPNITLGPHIVKALRGATTLPFEAHLMVEDPDRFIPIFVDAGCRIVTIHAEASKDPVRSLRLISSLGGTPAVAVNPATPLSVLDYLLEEVSMVLIMTVSPGFAGGKLVESSIGKIERLAKIVGERKLQIDIGVDGNVSFENAPRMRKAGANLFVCGTSSLFTGRMSYEEAVRKFLELVAA